MITSTRTKNYSFHFLNATQFLGALNDNIFKLLIIYLLINVKGLEAAPSILATVGAVFVIPFLVFSSAAGILADRISKRSILVSMKVVEAVIMLFSIFSIYFQSELFCYVFLFSMAAQSALFGPSKYGIIPEIVPEEKVSKANGIMTSLTFLAIIFGTFLATFITDITNKNFVVGSLFCFFIAVAGLITSLKIEVTKPQRSKRKIRPLFIYEIYKTLALSYKRVHLLPAIIGSAFFLFIGAFVQLNIIPFAIQSLKLTEVGGGYLFLATAIGIALGSLAAGKISKDKVQPGISCISGFVLSFLLILLFCFSKFLLATILILIFLGFFGGLFLIPLDSFIQIAAPDARRGQIVSASNFLGFTGVLVASACLWINSDILKISSASGFALIGFITLIFSTIMAGRLSDLFFPYLMQKVFLKFIPYSLSSLPETNSLIIFEKKNWIDAFMLFALLPKLKIITIRKKLFDFPFINGLFLSFGIISEFKHPKDKEKWLIKLANHMKRRNEYVCLFLEDISSRNTWKDCIAKEKDNEFTDVVFIHIEKEKITKSIFGFDVSLEKSSVYFTDEPLNQKAYINSIS